MACVTRRTCLVRACVLRCRPSFLLIYKTAGAHICCVRTCLMADFCGTHDHASALPHHLPYLADTTAAHTRLCALVVVCGSVRSDAFLYARTTAAHFCAHGTFRARAAPPTVAVPPRRCDSTPFYYTRTRRGLRTFTAVSCRRALGVRRCAARFPFTTCRFRPRLPAYIPCPATLYLSYARVRAAPAIDNDILSCLL